MVTLKARVTNEFGIHCRPSAVIAQEAQRRECRITVRTASGETNARSVLGVLGLAVRCGEDVEIEVDGADEEAVCRRFVELFETNFDFPR